MTASFPGIAICIIISFQQDNKVLIWNPNESIKHSDGNIPSGEVSYNKFVLALVYQ